MIQKTKESLKKSDSNDALTELWRAFSYLGEESPPNEASSLPSKGARTQLRPKTGDLVHVHRGIEIRRVTDEWLKERGDGGVYVGKGSNGLSRSVFHETFRSSLNASQARKLLESRPLYLGENEPVSIATEIIDFFDAARAQTTPAACPWHEYFRHLVDVLLQGQLSITQLGVALKEMIRLRPSPLGLCRELLEICAIGTLDGGLKCLELLPMRLPPDTAAERQVLNVLHRLKAGSALTPMEMDGVKRLMHDAGIDAWTWIQVLLVNYLYLGRERLIGHGMVHSREWSEVQKEAGKVFVRNARLWCEGNPGINIGAWHEVSESLGELYTGKEWRKCYKLTWSSISPSIPKPGEAAKIPLSQVLPERLQKFAEDPELLRLADDEVINGRHRCPSSCGNPRRLGSNCQ